MKVASISALAVSLFFASVYAGPQVPGGTVPVNTVPAPSSSDETFTPVESKVINGQLLTPVVSRKAYSRLEIRQLQKKKAQWNLFLLATREWQKEAQLGGTDSSYYGISRIHGLPFGEFNKATGGPDTGGGYCPHSTVIFPSWHRVYVATYEQQLLARAYTIANSWTGTATGMSKSDMVTAAAQLRMPYWDWAMIPDAGTNSLPDSIANPTIDIIEPNGILSKDTVNPLAGFQFANADIAKGMYYPVFDQWTSTKRYPDRNATDAISNRDQLVKAFSPQYQQYLQDKAYQLVFSCKDYGHFSTDLATKSSPECSTSLESLHNGVHTTAGGGGFVDERGFNVSGGHMTYLPLASYDPLFWLHHANVDRLYALWQGINPGVFGASAPAGNPTFTIAYNQTVGPSTPLMPFLKDSTTWWTTTDVQFHNTTFGYTYPELEQKDRDLTTSVQLLYGPSARAGGSSKRSLTSYAPAGKVAAPSSIDNSKLAANGSEYQFNANVQTPRHALGSSYSVWIFIGEPAVENPSTWASDANLVGQMGVLADAPGSTMVMHEVIISGSVPLTRALHKKLESGELKSMAPTDVEPYLKANLKWKISVTGRCVEPTTLEGFIVSVVSTTVAQAADISQPPVYSTFHPIVDITAGIAGGLNATTQLLGDVVDDVKDCVTDVVSDVAKGDIGGVVDSVVGGVKDTLGSLTSGLSNIGKAFTAPAAAAAKAPSSASTY